MDVLTDRLPWTLLQIVPALILKALLGTLLGALAAWKRRRRARYRPADWHAGARLDAGLWTGMILISVFAVKLWLAAFVRCDAAGRLGGGLALVAEVGRRLILPVTTITLASVGSIFLLARAAMLTTLGEDYSLMAEAKGLPDRTIMLRHALANALPPVYTSLTLSLGVLASGAVVVETVFSYRVSGASSMRACWRATSRCCKALSCW